MANDGLGSGMKALARRESWIFWCQAYRLNRTSGLVDQPVA